MKSLTMPRKAVLSVIAAAFAALVTAPGVSVAYEAGAVSGGGSIGGTVKFKGAPPAAKALEITKDKEVCAKTAKNVPDLVVGSDGGIKFAVVSITNISKGKAFGDAKTVVDQSGCEYAPHVVLSAPGSIEIKNSDGILHNIHTYSKDNPPVNMAQPQFKKTMQAKFEKPEIIKLTCDVHGWMSGYVVVQNHPYYAVTDDSGSFKLADVPPGDYELKVWHEKLGETTQKVSVQGGAETKVNFELAPK